MKNVINRNWKKAEIAIAECVRRINNPKKYKTLGFWCDYLGGRLNKKAENMRVMVVNQICTKWSTFLPKNSLCMIESAEDLREIKGADSLVFFSNRDYSDWPCLIVENPMEAYAKMCRYYRDLQCKMSMVAITGSIGKTTVKNMIGEVLDTQFKTVWTDANVNAKTGVGFAVQHIPKWAEKMVQEVHEGNPDEVQYISELLYPNTVVITSIDKSHFVRFGSEEKILKEVCSITKKMQPTGVVIVNMDEFSRFDLLNGRTSVTISTSNVEADFYADSVKVDEAGLSFYANVKAKGERYPVRLFDIWAVHNVNCALYAFAAAYCEGVVPSNIIKGLANYRTKGQRQNVLKTNGGIVVYADCYNAIAKSVRSAIVACDLIPVIGKRIAVLGDVQEAGEITASTHREILGYVNESKFNVLLLKGVNLKNALEHIKMKDSFTIHCCDSNEDISVLLKSIVRSGDLVLFKSSHSGKLEECIVKVWPELKKEMDHESFTFNKWKTRSLYY